MAVLRPESPSCRQRRFWTGTACGEHGRRIVRHDYAAVATDGDEASGGAALGEFMLEGPPDRLGEIRVGVADPSGDVVRYDAADECLAVSGTRDRHDIVAGVNARADDRGVSDAPLGLAGHPARGRGGGDATGGIAGHRAYRPMAGGDRTAVHYLVQLLPARLGDEVVALDHFKSPALKERDVRGDGENRR